MNLIFQGLHSTEEHQKWEMIIRSRSSLGLTNSIVGRYDTKEMRYNEKNK